MMIGGPVGGFQCWERVSSVGKSRTDLCWCRVVG